MNRLNGFQKSMVTNDGYFGTKPEKQFPATGKRKEITGKIPADRDNHRSLPALPATACGCYRSSNFAFG